MLAPNVVFTVTSYNYVDYIYILLPSYVLLLTISKLTDEPTYEATGEDGALPNNFDN